MLQASMNVGIIYQRTNEELTISNLDRLGIANAKLTLVPTLLQLLFDMFILQMGK